MSKKARRKKHTGRASHGWQLEKTSPALLRPQLVEQLYQARQELRIGNFLGVISACERLLLVLPERRSDIGVELLAMLGLAHGMLDHYEQSYDLFSEAIDIDPMNAELWYNRGLTSSSMNQVAASVQDLERAVELSRNKTSEATRRFAARLQEGRQELEEEMRLYGGGITLAQYREHEVLFASALNLVKQRQWSEAESLFRQLAQAGYSVPSYWGNLGVCLLAQARYDEAEEALKQALSIDPDYALARDNLQKMPSARRSRQPLEPRIVNMYRTESEPQVITFSGPNGQREPTSNTVVQRVGHAVSSTWRAPEQQPPLYDFLLNVRQDTRVTICPRCQIKTRARKFPLVVRINADYGLVIEKMCRFCTACELLVVHQDQLHVQLLFRLLLGPQRLSNDYQVVGTLESTVWKQGIEELQPFADLQPYLHDFKQVVVS